jgi:hypothetical protein
MLRCRYIPPTALTSEGSARPHRRKRGPRSRSRSRVGVSPSGNRDRRRSASDHRHCAGGAERGGHRGSARTAARSSSRWPTATGSRPSPGRTCCGTPNGAGCARRCWPSATARSASGARCARCSRTPESGAAGSTKSGNVLAALPKSAHPAAKTALAEIWGAEDKTHALAAAKALADLFGAKFPKAAREDHRRPRRTAGLLYDYPAEHWVHLLTTNPIESTFATVRHRTKITPEPGSEAAGLAMACKLIMAAQDRWRAVNAPHLVALAAPAPPSSTASSSNDQKINHWSRHPPKPPHENVRSTGIDNCSTLKVSSYCRAPS